MINILVYILNDFQVMKIFKNMTKLSWIKQNFYFYLICQRSLRLSGSGPLRVSYILDNPSYSGMSKT
jgi:hypothetical protein